MLVCFASGAPTVIYWRANTLSHTGSRADMDIAEKVAPRKTARSRKLAPWANGQWFLETSTTKTTTEVCSQILHSSLPKTPLAYVMYNSLLLPQIDRLTEFIGAQKQFTRCCCCKLEFVSLAGNLIQDAGYFSGASKTGLVMWKAICLQFMLCVSRVYMELVAVWLWQVLGSHNQLAKCFFSRQSTRTGSKKLFIKNKNWRRQE